jgi:hypothetical protein
MSSAVIYSNAVNLANEIHQIIANLNHFYQESSFQHAASSLNNLNQVIEELQRFGKSQVQQEKREIIQK